VKGKGRASENHWWLQVKAGRKTSSEVRRSRVVEKRSAGVVRERIK